MTRAPEAVSVSDLHKSFGTHSVLRGVNLEAPAGSLTAILGPSGSGKTTLLRIVAGLERPDAGAVAIGTTVVDDGRMHVPVERRRLGYVSQEGSLFPHLNVRGNVSFGLPRHRRRSAKVDELLAVVGVEDLAHRYPHQLSGGQQQRVALARALATEPAVMLLDEPFSSLDASLRASVRAEICGILQQAGTTVLLVTHDQDEALSTAGLVAVLRRGTVAQVGTPRDLYDHPVDAELATFVGDANLIEGHTNNGGVATAFGLLPLCRPLVDARSAQRLTVLVRPEQVTVTTDADGQGIPAHILTIDYHGHDAILHLAPEDPRLPSGVVARVAGGLHVFPGAKVHLSAKGPVEAWRSTDQAARRSARDDDHRGDRAKR